MDLKWPLLLLPIAAAIGVAVWYAMKHTRSGWQVELPYLARSYRLTTLPEYQRALRLHERISVAALVLAVVAVFMLIGATVRPTKTYQSQRTGSDNPHVDIMLCFGPDFTITSAASDGTVIGNLMSIMREKVDGFDNQRIGLTKDFYRSFPVTSDLPWVSDRLDAIAEIAKGPSGDGNFREKAQLFERTNILAVTNVNDTVASCAMGLPAVGSDNGRGRAIIYIGDTEYSRSAPPIYSDEMLLEVIKDAGIQLNTIVPGTNPGEFFDNVVKASGGHQYLFTRLGNGVGWDKPTPDKLANQKDELQSAVDKILSDPPPSVLDERSERRKPPFQWDVPDVLLQIALIAAVLLAATRLGMRR
jgi:Ca-activated chloride channel homolog